MEVANSCGFTGSAVVSSGFTVAIVMSSRGQVPFNCDGKGACTCTRTFLALTRKAGLVHSNRGQTFSVWKENIDQIAD